ncbi:ABC transporter ATP-binding protein [Gordonia rubripertincta]|uniref:ABC transporter ATP-binding protein n=1 Tax=Gordonia rubripertincta TaxID=36822 RepID=A0AAW4G492_GORRU|nr:ABC transporter ATP-binding protein [Gordonia rubripertincta]MBM7278030.1 ABC transporter ATP-binding protein [Gordonia rubripertincta]QMU22462.1 ABC transporter ATP-binding protein [Gordonia rubripertincta]
MPVAPSLNRGQVRALVGLVGTALKASPWVVGGFVVFQLASVFTSLAQPALNAAIIDDGILRGDVGTIKVVGLLMVAVAVVNLAVSLGATYLASHLSASSARDLRGRVNGRIGMFTDQQVARLGLSSLLTRSTGDVAQIQGFLFIFLTVVVTAPLMLFGALVLSLSQAWQMAPVIFVAGLILVALVGVLVRRIVPWAARLQRRLDTINRVLREQLRGIPVIRTFRQEDRERARFAVENDELTDVALRLGRTQVLLLPTVTVVSNLAGVAVAALGAIFVDRGQMQIGQIAAAVGYLGQILLAVSLLTVIAGVIPRAVTSADRIVEVLDTEVLESGDAEAGATSPAPAVVFDAVSVGFPGADAPAVDAISLTCAAGTVTGLLGGTGSGKSTLLSLPLRFADPDSGVVRWDGADVTGLAPAWVRARTAFVGQGAALVTGTIADNLRIGRPDATDDQMWEALEVAAARDFVEARPEGLGARVAQEGRNFSGGQRQRLALARAVLRRPALYVLDDPFSALDVDTEQQVIANLRRAHPEATVLIAAQRVSSVRHADVIGVLEAGHLVAVGTDETLRIDSEIYREIAYAQAVTNV